MSRLLRTRTGLLSALRAPLQVTRGTFIAPRCALCDLPLDGEELVEAKGEYARVLGKHHGSEELAEFRLGTEHWEPEDLSRSMRGHRWFAPDVAVGAMNDK